MLAFHIAIHATSIYKSDCILSYAMKQFGSTWICWNGAGMWRMARKCTVLDSNECKMAQTLWKLFGSFLDETPRLKKTQGSETSQIGHIGSALLRIVPIGIRDSSSLTSLMRSYNALSLFCVAYVMSLTSYASLIKMPINIVVQYGWLDGYNNRNGSNHIFYLTIDAIKCN